MNIRQARKDDSKALCSILNEIINIGGTTAFEKELSESEIQFYFINGKNCICCFVAEENEVILGFQSLSYHPKLSDDWADIASFARVNPKTSGVGTALFARTLDLASQKNINWLNATIRADNKPGLAYYSKMGFKDYAIAEKNPTSGWYANRSYF